MRVFVALNLSARWDAMLIDVQRRLRRHDPASAVRWVDPANIHLTLRFLGEVDPENVRSLTNALDAALADAAPPLLAPGALGAFPSPRRPRVIWIGLAETGARLVPLQARVEAAVRQRGWEAETRAFRPHLTLGRGRDSRRSGMADLGAALATEPVPTWEPQPQTQVALVRSHLGRHGARYETLRTWTLG